MVYFLPIIYFLMVYGAMYHVPRYIPPVTENTANGSSLPAPVKKEATLEAPPEPKPVPKPETTLPAVPADSAPEQTLTESATKENIVNGSSLPTTDKKDAYQEIPSEQRPVSTGETTNPPDPRPVPSGDTTIPPVPAESEPLSSPEQTPSLNTESVSKDTPVNEGSLPLETPSPLVPVVSEAQAVPEQTSPLSAESPAPVVPVPSESSVTEQNNEAGNVPVSPEKQDSAPVEVKDLQQENVVPAAVPAEAEMTEVPEKAAE